MFSLLFYDKLLFKLRGLVGWRREGNGRTYREVAAALRV